MMCDVYVFAVADVTGFLRKERLVRCGDVIDVIPDSVLSYYIIVLCVGARSGERTFLRKTRMQITVAMSDMEVNWFFRLIVDIFLTKR